LPTWTIAAIRRNSAGCGDGTMATTSIACSLAGRSALRAYSAISYDDSAAKA
jgi:hypothetical protein